MISHNTSIKIQNLDPQLQACWSAPGTLASGGVLPSPAAPRAFPPVLPPTARGPVSPVIQLSAGRPSPARTSLTKTPYVASPRRCQPYPACSPYSPALAWPGVMVPRVCLPLPLECRFHPDSDVSGFTLYL